MSYDIEANHNRAARGANQGIGNQNRNDNAIMCISKGTAIIIVIGLLVVFGISIGVGVGVGMRNQENLAWVPLYRSW